MMNRYDVVVIGGGPIGAVTARSAATFGARVLLVERSASTDDPSPCTGLVSPRTLPALGVTESSVVRRIRSIDAYAPGGRRLTLTSAAVKGLVLDRASLRAELHARARDAGATILLGREAIDVRPGSIDLRSTTSTERLEARVIVIATGLATALPQRLSLPTPVRLFRAVQAVIDREPERPDAVSTYFGARIAPEFFGWAVPAEPGRMRVGLAVSPDLDPVPFLESLLESCAPGTAVRSRLLGRVAIGPVSEPFGDGLLLVGDAAGQVKPLTGGGLYTGAICARIAGRTAASAAASRKTERKDLCTYAADCDRAIGDEIRFGLAARDLLESLSDEGIDDAFAAADHPDLLRFLGVNGDIDRLRRLPRRLAAEPALWKRLLPLLSLLDRHLASRASRAVAPPAKDSL